MDIVPVIDLKGGLVVHARAGERQCYPPLRSILTHSCAPVEVVAALLTLHPFRQLYIADLDAIAMADEHHAVIRELHARFPEIELWVDAGFRDACDATSFLGAGLGTLVLGSESQSDPSLLERLQGDPRVVLSLDFKDKALDPGGIIGRPELWPARLIVMTLAAVGGSGGPDQERLASIIRLAPRQRIYAAGGVRGLPDLEALQTQGCAGALIASALHDGRLGRHDLAALAA